MSPSEPANDGRLRALARRLPPTAFSFVMATGIVGNASALVGIPYAPAGLFAINVVAYAALWVLLGARLVLYGQEVLADLENHARGPGILTTVAGTAVFGTQWILVAKLPAAGLVLWGLAVVLWLGLTYALFARLLTLARGGVVRSSFPTQPVHEISASLLNVSIWMVERPFSQPTGELTVKLSIQLKQPPVFFVGPALKQRLSGLLDSGDDPLPRKRQYRLSHQGDIGVAHARELDERAEELLALGQL